MTIRISTVCLLLLLAMVALVATTTAQEDSEQLRLLTVERLLDEPLRLLEEDSTEGPSNTAYPSDTEEPTDNPMVTTVPATEAPSAAPMETLAPTEGEVEETDAPTTSPTVPGTMDESMEESKEDSSEDECDDNKKTYTVLVDIQITYNDTAELCSGAEDTDISMVISDTLNSAFKTTVSDWEGTAEFDDFDMDTAQDVNMIGDSSGVGGRRRRLRGGKTVTVQRQLEDEDDEEDYTCTARGGDVECNQDFCRWGCIEVETTNCGTPSFEQWPALADDIKAALEGYDCLGVYEDLTITVMLDNGEGDELPEPTNSPTEQLDGRNFETDEPTASPTSPPTDSEGGEAQPAPPAEEEEGEPTSSPTSPPTDTEPVGNFPNPEDDLAADGYEYSVDSEMLIVFFKQENCEKFLADTTKLIADEAQFFETTLAESDISHDFLKIEIRHLAKECKGATLDMTFSTIADFAVADTQSEKSVAQAIAGGDYKSFIHRLMSDGIWGVKHVHFIGTGRGENR